LSITSFLAAIAIAGSPASAQQFAVDPAGAPILVYGPKQPAEEEVVCKYTSTGTMFRKQVCRPASEWTKAEAKSEDTLRAMRDWQRIRCSFGTRC
jgi:hypothetical protein